MAIDDLAKFVSRLRELTHAAASPPVERVLHQAIPLASDDSGVAVTMVPESESGPHMAGFGNGRYYKRAGDRFYRMEHYDIADMFGRRRKGVLMVEARQVGNGIVVSLGNTGRSGANTESASFDGGFGSVESGSAADDLPPMVVPVLRRELDSC